jgi:hypothetical protein
MSKSRNLNSIEYSSKEDELNGKKFQKKPNQIDLFAIILFIKIILILNEYGFLGTL